MNEGDVMTLARQAIMVTLAVSLPVLLFGLIAGVVISVLQAVTQVQEMTLSYVPKLLAVSLALLLFGSWMLNQMVTFTRNSFTRVPTVNTRR